MLVDTDALIAATAWYLGRPLVTANARPYCFMEEVELIVFRP